MSDPVPPWWLKPMNKVMMAVQRLGIPTGPAMVLTVPGRNAGVGTLTHARRSRRVRIVALTPEQSRPVLRAFAVKVPVGVEFAKRSGLVIDGTPDEFEALAGRLAVFRLDPAIG